MTIENFAAVEREDAEQVIPAEPEHPGIAATAIVAALETLHSDLMALRETEQEPAPSVIFVGPIASTGSNGVTVNQTARYRVSRLVIIDAGGTAFTIRQGTGALLVIPALAAPPTTLNIIDLPLPIVIEQGTEFRVEAGGTSWTAYLIAYPDAAAKS